MASDKQTIKHKGSTSVHTSSCFYSLGIINLMFVRSMITADNRTKYIHTYVYPDETPNCVSPELTYNVNTALLSHKAQLFDPSPPSSPGRIPLASPRASPLAGGGGGPHYQCNPCRCNHSRLCLTETKYSGDKPEATAAKYLLDPVCNDSNCSSLRTKLRHSTAVKTRLHQNRAREAQAGIMKPVKTSTH